MFDGRIIVTGGNTDTRTSWFTPASMTWSAGPQMNLGRGYQVLTGIMAPSMSASSMANDDSHS